MMNDDDVAIYGSLVFQVRSSELARVKKELQAIRGIRIIFQRQSYGYLRIVADNAAPVEEEI